MPTALANLQPLRIALIKPSALGDIVHSLPVLSALRQRWPAARITWVVNRAYASLLKGHPDLDAVLPFDRGAIRREPLSVVRFARAIRAGRFDLAIDLQGLFRTGLMCVVCGADRRVGFAGAREGADRCYTDRIDVHDADQIHAVDRYWRVVEALGAGDAPKRFIVPIPAAARAQADSLLAEWPRPWLMIGVGARWITKRWPPANFAAVASDISARFGGSTIFIGSAEDAPLAQKAQIHLPAPALDLCGKTSLSVLAALLERADAMLANDTGPLHLAAALGRPTVAPYTCTRVALHGPYGQFHRTVSADIACQGSYLRTCPHLNCLPTLPPGRVLPLVVEALSSWARRQPA